MLPVASHLRWPALLPALPPPHGNEGPSLLLLTLSFVCPLASCFLPLAAFMHRSRLPICTSRPRPSQPRPTRPRHSRPRAMPTTPNPSAPNPSALADRAHADRARADRAHADRARADRADADRAPEQPAPAPEPTAPVRRVARVCVPTRTHHSHTPLARARQAGVAGGRVAGRGGICVVAGLCEPCGRVVVEAHRCDFDVSVCGAVNLF